MIYGFIAPVLSLILFGWYPLSAPSSSLSRVSAHTTGNLWVLADPGHRAVMDINPLQDSSMIPILDGGSVLLLEEVDPQSLRIADIAVYDREDELVCHRVRAIRSTDGFILFEGDNNKESDGWISPAKIKWRVAGVIYTQRDK